MVKRSRRGFTLIEVSFFLALSGLLMVGIISGTTASISRQRYNDSVNSAAEAIRSVYSDVLNVSLIGEEGTRGRSGQAVYGKLIILNENEDGEIKKSQVNSYTIIGDAANSSTLPSTANTLNLLFNAETNAGLGAKVETSQKNYTIVPWDTKFESPDGNLFRGAILVVRSPRNGVIHTYLATKSSEFSVDDLDESSEILSAGFLEQDVNICIDSFDNHYGRRRNLRIHAGAANSSGVDLIALDSDDNECGDGHAGD